MNVGGDPYVIEYNVRMGDPETEAVIPRITGDLVELLLATGQGRLSEVPLAIDPRTAVTVVLVSGGYPNDYKKGIQVSGHSEGGRASCFTRALPATSGERSSPTADASSRSPRSAATSRRRALVICDGGQDPV